MKRKGQEFVDGLNPKQRRLFDRIQSSRHIRFSARKSGAEDAAIIAEAMAIKDEDFLHEDPSICFEHLGHNITTIKAFSDHLDETRNRVRLVEVFHSSMTTKLARFFGAMLYTKFEHLNSLILKDVQVEGEEGIKPLLEEVKEHVSLKTIHFVGMDLKNEAAMSEFADMGFIKTICLQNVQISLECLQIMSNACWGRHLEILTILNVKIGKEAVKVLAAAIRSYESLGSLDVRFCDLDDESIESLADAVTCHPSLLSLALHGLDYVGPLASNGFCRLLSQNKILDSLLLHAKPTPGIDLPRGPTGLGKALKENNTLEQLKLENFHVHPADAVELANGLAVNNRLKELLLSTNRIGHVGIKAIGRALRSNTSLESLEIDSTSHVGTSLLARTFRVNTSLDWVQLDVRNSVVSSLDELEQCILYNVSIAAMEFYSDYEDSDEFDCLHDARRLGMRFCDSD